MPRMSTHRRNALAVSVRWVLHKYALVWAAAASVAVISIAQNHQTEISKVRAGVTDAVLPLASALHAPLNWAHDIGARIHDFTNLTEANARLQRENATLRGWQQEAMRLRAENAQMAELLKAVPTPQATALTARVVSESGGAFQNSLLALAGVDDGVEVGSVVMGEKAVVGRVVEAGSRAARVLLISDENSRLPVQLETSGERAIATGTGNGEMVLKYLPDDVMPVIGERVVTSGHGGVFPTGLPVGEVVADSENGWRIAPIERLNAKQFVRIVDYRVSTEAGVAASQPGK